jgi:hypothetical protein
MQTAIKAGAGALLSLVISLPLVSVAHAGPNDAVNSPIVEEGEREIGFQFGASTARDGSGESALSVGLAYGMNAWWSTELTAAANRQTPDGWRFDAFEWENKFQLTETGKYPVDVGVRLEIERPADRAEGWELHFGPLFQMEFTPALVANLNLLLGRHVAADKPAPTELDYQWQLRYRWKPELELGAQGFGSLGPWRDWLPSDQQVHQAGPAIFGKLQLAGHQALAYNAAWLIGTNSNTARNTLRLQVEYEY